MSGREGAPRDLLFGLLALQNGLVTRDQLVLAFASWNAAPGRPLAELLCERGALAADVRSTLEALVDAHVRLHGGDAERSVAAVSVGRSTRECLREAGGQDLEATLSRVGDRTTIEDEAQGDPTLTYAVGGAASDGHRFRVLRPHAHGNLGEVFVALDAELHREVALKQIRPDRADEPSSRQRFVVEAEITGGLEHPGIVPVYAFGAHADGRPYYAMRFVRGGNLKEAITAFHADPALKADPGLRALELRRLLRRMMDVCNAVDYAHSRGVLHRDLKPGNIIVGRHGETLVVDWGLAKARGHTSPADPESDEHTLRPRSGSQAEETQRGSLLGTPGYMGPEQAAGELDRLGPESDVYSLGATLYCLLTGRPPFSGSLDDILAATRAGRFPRPRELDPSIDRALEAVCLKAMATRREDRYPTARALADDIERWAGDEPVTAWRESLPRRAARWVRRHRTAAASALAVLVVGTAALGVGLAAVNRERLRVEQERLRAERHFEGARTLAGELVEAAEMRLSQSPGQEAARQKIYEAAVDHYDRLAAERTEDPELQREAGVAHFYLANMHRFYAKNDEAEAHYAEALARLDRVRALKPDDLRLRDRSAEVWRDRGQLASRLGRLRDASRMLGTALDLVRGLRAADPESIAFRRTEASLLLSSNEIEYALGREAEAETLAAETVERYAALVREAKDDGPEYATSSSARSLPLLHLMALNLHAGRLRKLGRFDEALARHQEALARAVEIRKTKATLDNDFQHAAAHVEYAWTLTEAPGRAADAEAPALAALDGFGKLLKANARSAIYIENEALAHHVVGRVRRSQQRVDDARKEFDAARQGLDRLIKLAPSIIRIHWEKGLLLDESSAFERSAGRAAPAEEQHEAAVAALKAATAASPEHVIYLRDLKRVEAAAASKP